MATSTLELNEQQKAAVPYTAGPLLVVAGAGSRKRYVEKVTCNPSRFLDELPKDLVEWRGEDTERDQELSRERATAHPDTLRKMFS